MDLKVVIIGLEDWTVCWSDGLVDTTYGGLGGGGVSRGKLVERTEVDCIMSTS